MTARIIRVLTIGDRTYKLYAYPCGERGEDLYRVVRSNGMLIAKFDFDHLSLDDFEDFCRDIDENLLLRAREFIHEFREGLHRNEKSASIRRVRVPGPGRIRLIRLQRFGDRYALLDASEPLPPENAALQAAFELGYSVRQHTENKYSEKYYLAGVQIVEARRAGQVRARQALTAKGRKTRTAVAKAAEQIRSHRPEIAHNVAAVAREIRKLGLPALCRSDGSPISEETICKYLRQARKCKKTENRQENPGSGKTSR